MALGWNGAAGPPGQVVGAITGVDSDHTQCPGLFECVGSIAYELGLRIIP